MDEDIMNYLDKVGQYLQGAGEKGFETYVHGIFVQSLVYAVLGVILLCVATLLIFKARKSYDMPEKAVMISIASVVIIIFGVTLIIENFTGVFAPDYIAIKEIAENIGGK